MAVQKMQGDNQADSVEESHADRARDTQLVHTVLSNLTTQIVQLTPRAGVFAEQCLRPLILLQARLSCGTDTVEKHDELVVTPTALRGRSVQEPDEEPALLKQANAKRRSHSAHAGRRLHRELNWWSPQQLEACETILVDLERCRMEMEDHRSCLASSSSPIQRPRSLPPEVVARPPSPREMPAPGRLTLPRTGTARHSPEDLAPANHCKETVARSKSTALPRHKRSSGRARRTSSEEAACALEKARALLSDMLTQSAENNSSCGDVSCSITEGMQEVQKQSARRHSSVPQRCISPTDATGHCFVSANSGRCDAGASQPLHSSMLGFNLEQAEGQT